MELLFSYFDLQGVLKGKFFKGYSLHYLNQNLTDGAIARYYSFNDWKKLVKDLFKVEDIRVMGSKAEMFPIPAGKV